MHLLDDQSGILWTYHPGKPDIDGPSKTKWNPRLAYINYSEASTILFRIWKLLTNDLSMDMKILPDP